MSPDDKIATFKQELSMISSHTVKQFAKECIASSPDYFFTACPSSSSGKYHPKDELDGNGCVIHTKRVCRMIPEIAAAYDIMGSADLMLCAGILHDSVKQGEAHSGHTVRNHPILAADRMAEIYKSRNDWGFDRIAAKVIYMCIRFHMGKWGTGKSAKPLSDFSREEMTIHLADVAASRHFVRVELA